MPAGILSYLYRIISIDSCSLKRPGGTHSNRLTLLGFVLRVNFAATLNLSISYNSSSLVDLYSFLCLFVIVVFYSLHFGINMYALGGGGAGVHGFRNSVLLGFQGSVIPPCREGILFYAVLLYQLICFCSRIVRARVRARVCVCVCVAYL